MKKILLVILTIVMSVCVSACGAEEKDKVNNETTVEKETKIEKNEEVKIKESPDKYTWYLKNYVGKNLASIGYTSLGGDRMDDYGDGYIKLVLVNKEGNYIDIEDEEQLKKYVVVDQNLKPNTEIKYTFQLDEDGNEYDSLVDWQTVEEVVLLVNEVGNKEQGDTTLTEINASADKYTYCIRDYVGRNLASAGYLSLGGNLCDTYGQTTIRLIIVTDDGSYVDLEDSEILKQYVVTTQNIEPNTELKCTFLKDENGEEYDNLVESQNIEEIELGVSLIEE